MNYPSLQEYNEALQHPYLALNDPILKNGQVKLTGLGLPLALCGGFALTYTISNGLSKYAVRCFQKENPTLQIRYRAIANKLNSIRSDFFVDFEYQNQGVKVNANWYPIVKMEWAKGETLGEFLERNHRRNTEIVKLIPLLEKLASFLEIQKIAHGDIQPGNVMVSNGTGPLHLQLIDYDGMFVESIGNLGSSEIGLKNFQHPGRTGRNWDYKLDRFSFIALNLALRALIADPSLWEKTQSDSETIIFTGNDYHDPEQSAIFADLFKMPQLAEDAKNFAKICKSEYPAIPSTSDFLKKQNIPQKEIFTKKTISYSQALYYSAYPILDATDYFNASQHVGERIELIGRITEVKLGRARNGNPYIFLNFGYWKNDIIKLAIWSESISIFDQQPDSSWEERWVSVIGLLENPYTSYRFDYTHISINITQVNQIRFISQTEARRRLAGKWTRPVTQWSNEQVIENMRSRDSVGTNTNQTRTYSVPAPKNNQQVLQNMKNSVQASHTQSSSKSAPLWQQTSKPSTSQPKTTGDHCFIATALFGFESTETRLLRRYRDEVLRKTLIGRFFIKTYYRLSPALVPLIKRNKALNTIMRNIIMDAIRAIQNKQR